MNMFSPGYRLNKANLERLTTVRSKAVLDEPKLQLINIGMFFCLNFNWQACRMLRVLFFCLANMFFMLWGYFAVNCLCFIKRLHLIYLFDRLHISTLNISTIDILLLEGLPWQSQFSEASCIVHKDNSLQTGLRTKILSIQLFAQNQCSDALSWWLEKSHYHDNFVFTVKIYQVDNVLKLLFLTGPDKARNDLTIRQSRLLKF